jgi:hypothetical protein
MERGTYFGRDYNNDWREFAHGHEDGYVRHQVEERKGEYLEEGEIVQDQGAAVLPLNPGHNFVASQDGWNYGDGAFVYPEQLEYNSALHTSTPENRTADSGGYVEACSKAGSNHEAEVHHQQGGDPYSVEDRLATEPIWAAHGSEEYPPNADPYQYDSYETAEAHDNAEPAQQRDMRAHEPGAADKFQGSFSEGYPHYDASQDYSGYWKEGDASATQYGSASSDLQHSGRGHAQEAQTYNYADYGTYYAYGQNAYVAETYSAPSNNQPSEPGSGYVSAPGANQPLEASNADASTLITAEEIATKHEPVKRAIKKPDKTKFVLGKNK